MNINRDGICMGITKQLILSVKICINVCNCLHWLDVYAHVYICSLRASVFTIFVCISVYSMCVCYCFVVQFCFVYSMCCVVHAYTICMFALLRVNMCV